jgi:hypothetical protein
LRELRKGGTGAGEQKRLRVSPGLAVVLAPGACVSEANLLEEVLMLLF